ncbi:MAG: phosphotransferase [Dehalococcoidales bacterium]|nr:phosphotransferase [Dehalococcoidales bacterium]
MSELPELVQALLDPQSYPGPPKRVELIQTQISYVFIAGDLVYKVKKPVDMGFLDYSTLEKRLTLCIKELELNRRLCPDAYLEVVPVTGDDGKIVMDGRGDIKEYAVKMRRLPREAMMDYLLQQNNVTPDMLAMVAKKLAVFHRSTATDEIISDFGTLEAVTRITLEDNFGQTAKYVGTVIPPEKYNYLKERTGNFLKKNAPLFQKRVSDGRIRDCHGDLHAAHVCFTGNICIYDCIEFNDSLRYTDVAAEVAFLAMDLDHYGRSDLSNSFIDAYVKESGDEELRSLLDFYKCYRAYVRAKVGCFQYDDKYIDAGEKEKILENTRSYVKLAESYAENK